MRQSERASIVRIVSDIIKSDSVIDLKELSAYQEIKEKYAIKKEDEELSASFTLADAVNTLSHITNGLINDLLGDIKRVVMADGVFVREEALLTLAMQCCLTDRLGCAGKVISICSQEVYRTDSQILYVESEYDKETNTMIQKYFREIVLEARLSGFDFLYLPQIINHYHSVSDETLIAMAAFLYPNVSEERCVNMLQWLENITTSSFCKELFVSKLGMADLADVTPSLLVKIGYSYVQNKFYTNYLLIEIDKDVLQLVRDLFDAFSTFFRTTKISYIKEDKERFVFAGFYKQLFDFYMFRKGIKSSIVIDIYRNEIRFPEADAVLAKLHRREKALYTLFLLESASGGVNFAKPNCAGQLDRYNKRMLALQKKYGLIYQKFGGEVGKAPNLSSSEVRLPMISLIKKQIKGLSDVLDNSNDYSIQRNIYGNYGVGISTAYCFCCGLDKKDIKPLFEVEEWMKISAL